MAVTNSPNPSRLTLVQLVGNTLEGKPIYKSKSYSNVKSTATDQDVYDIADALAALSVHPTIRVERTDQEVLSEI